MRGLGLLGVAVCGLLAGWVAKRVLNRRQSLFANLMLGLAGAFAGEWIGRWLGLQFSGLGGGLVLATIGSVVLLALIALLPGSG